LEREIGDNKLEPIKNEMISDQENDLTANILIKNFDLNLVQRKYLIEIEMEGNSHIYFYDSFICDYYIDAKYFPVKIQENNYIHIRIFDMPESEKGLFEYTSESRKELKLICEGQIKFESKKKEIIQRIIVFYSTEPVKKKINISSK
jgi:hypothetical protein